MFGDNRETMRKRRDDFERAFNRAKTQRLSTAIASRASLNIEDKDDYGWLRLRVEIIGKADVGPEIILREGDDLQKAATSAVDWIVAQR